MSDVKQIDGFVCSRIIILLWMYLLSAPSAIFSLLLAKPDESLTPRGISCLFFRCIAAICPVRAFELLLKFPQDYMRYSSDLLSTLNHVNIVNHVNSVNHVNMVNSVISIKRGAT